jgi:hypothetical protein
MEKYGIIKTNIEINRLFGGRMKKYKIKEHLL